MIINKVEFMEIIIEILRSASIGRFFLYYLCFLLISLLAISSAQTTGQYGINFVPLQIRWYVIGAFIVAFVMYFEPDQYKKMSWYIIWFWCIFITCTYFYARR